MKQLINGKLYDTAKALQVLTVDAPTGTQTLFLSGHYNFFVMEPTGQLTPKTKNEVVDFLKMAKDYVPDADIQQVYNYLPASYSRQSKVMIPDHAKLLAEVDGERLLYFAGKFYMHNGEADKKLSKPEALQWIEDNQRSIDLDTVLPFFPRIRKAWF